MKRTLLFLILKVFMLQGMAQVPADSTWRTHYRESAEKINDLKHTRLEVRFDYAKRWMYGKAWVTLKPHFYPTDSLTLDAQGIEISLVSITRPGNEQALKYQYDGTHLKVQLDKRYSNRESYTIYIAYTAKPYEAKDKPMAHGLYFINPEGKPGEPVQVWTDGETHYTSFWCPTIDQPNQRSTEEISMTVPAKYVTLSNGKLVSQQKQPDGTRTDHWKMDLPHAPYLFFMAAGDFAIVKDQYKGKEISYYVEKEYKPYARRIFGLTPAMIAFYERVTGVPYPWVKYAQISLRNFTSTAMENTSSTAHGQAAQQDERELADGNRWESNIAHELFHQWFGDYVTCESWSNLTLNESFANYGQYLWKEHQYGADAAGEESYNNIQYYLRKPDNAERSLVRFYYEDQEDMTDDVSYNKGGAILHMLRSYVGDEAFFKALQLYLEKNKFRSAEAHQLRLAFEEITGQDLNWFWNEWYFGKGHPKVDISYAFNGLNKTVTVNLVQTQGVGQLFRFPLVIDTYAGDKKTSRQIWVNKAKETFTFPATAQPDLVNVDAGKGMLWKKTDHKTLPEYIYQYRIAGTYADRREAITACYQFRDQPEAFALLKNGLRDKYWGLRLFTLEQFRTGWVKETQEIKRKLAPALADMATTEKHPLVQAVLLELLGNYQQSAYKPFFTAHLHDASYRVAGASLNALATVDTIAAFAEACDQMTRVTKGALTPAVINVLMTYGSEEQSGFVIKTFGQMPGNYYKLLASAQLATYLKKVNNDQDVRKAIDLIFEFRSSFPPAYRTGLDNNLKDLAVFKKRSGLQDQASYIDGKILGN